MPSKVILGAMRRDELVNLAYSQQQELERLQELGDAAGAVARVQELAARFERDAETDTPASPVARAIAIEIRNALDL